MLKILQARLQQFVNQEQTGFRKWRGTRDQIANIHWTREKAREFQKNIYFSFTDYAKAFNCVDHNKLWKILKEVGIPDRLPYLPPEKPVCRSRSKELKTDMQQWIGSKLEKSQGCILSPCLFNLHAEYIMQNARLDEAQAGIKIAGRNITNLRYADETTLMAES